MPESHGAIIVAHVSLGAVAVAAGAGALAARKGAAFHIRSGRLFAAAMVLSSALGAVLGLLNAGSFYITFHAGVLGVTLIASSWLTARARSQRLSAATAAVGIVNIINTAGLIVAGLRAQSSPDGVLFGFPAEDYFFLSAMAGLAAAGDISVVIRRTLSDRHRIARHLWRMCLGFFIAAGSAFTGPGAKIFPEAVRSAGVLSLPELFIILLMLFWLVRTYFRRSASTVERAP